MDYVENKARLKSLIAAVDGVITEAIKLRADVQDPEDTLGYAIDSLCNAKSELQGIFQIQELKRAIAEHRSAT